MKKTFYLVVNSNGTTKTTKNLPALNWNEIAISVNLDIPDILFKKPQLNASIVVPQSAVSPKEIDVNITDNIKNAIESVSGMKVMLTIQEKEESE